MEYLISWYDATCVIPEIRVSVYWDGLKEIDYQVVLRDRLLSTGQGGGAKKQEGGGGASQVSLQGTHCTGKTGKMAKRIPCEGNTGNLVKTQGKHKEFC